MAFSISGLPPLRPTPPRSFFTPPPPPSADGVTLSAAARALLEVPGAHSDDKYKDANLTEIPKPDPKLPDSWAPPPSTRMDGKCGLTGVSNMLRFYGVEKNPKDIDERQYRSWGPGMRADKFAENLTTLSGKQFHSKSLPEGTEPLQYLRDTLKEGKPVAIQYMTSPTKAHWVVVTGVKDTPEGVKLQCQSWGGWYESKWDDIKGPWQRGYGGPFPHVVGDEKSSKLP